MLRFIKKYFFEILIFIIVVCIFFTNYISGTYLIGWDSLQTELYPWISIKRALFSVWEEYQSFGLTTGMAHAADLIRSIFIFLLSLFIRTDLIRYVFHNLMLLVGGIGAFKLFLYINSKSKSFVFPFLGSALYILNLGTVQMFGLPFEPFSVFFAFLPWLILEFYRYLEEKENARKNLFRFIIVNLLATPAFYQQALFLVYLIVLFSFSLGMLIKNTFSFSEKGLILSFFKRTFIVFFIIFAINSFWIFPQLYSIGYSTSVTSQSKINQLATENVIDENNEKGKIQYLARFENFYYELKDTNKKYLFAPWREYFSDRYPLVLSYVPFAIVLFGLIYSRKKNDIPLLIVFLFTFVIFLGGTFPISYLGDLLRKVSFIGIVFRSPFTKFIFPFTLSFSYFFVLGLEFLYNLFSRLFFKSRGNNLSLKKSAFCLIVLSLIFYINFPVFKGNMFLSQMKIKLPDQYIEVFDYFKGKDKNSRIALLPDYTFWGWFQNKWGYDGSGFLWYGVEQPVVSRTFDVWSKQSESYFWEMKRAIELQEPDQFKKVLDKYNIDYLLVDKSSKSITSAAIEFEYERINQILSSVNGVSLDRSFSDIDIYKVDHNVSQVNNVLVSSGLLNIGNSFDITDYDKAYIDNGPYLTEESSKYDILYPFIDLMTQTDKFNKSWDIKETEDNFVVTAHIENFDPNDYVLQENPISLRAKVFDGEEIHYYDIQSNIAVRENEVEVSIKKSIVEDVDVENVDIVNCRNNYTDFGEDHVKDGVLKVFSINRSTACFSYGKPFLAHWNGYMVKVNSEEIKGKSLLFYIAGNKSKAQSKVEENLTNGIRYFILGEGGYFDDGYNFGFQNVSYFGSESRNNLNGLEIYLFPFNYVKNIKFVRKGVSVSEPDVKSLSDVKKLNYSIYYVKSGDKFHNTLILNQAYDDGWSLWCGIKKCDAKHVKISGWENGWVFENSIPSKILIVYWPQFLEYAGFLLSALSIILLLKNRDKISVER